MSSFELTKIKMTQGVWEGLLTAREGQEGSTPQIRVTHLGQELPNIDLRAGDGAGKWHVIVTIPSQAIADGVQTLVIEESGSNTTLGHITLMGGDLLADDLRAEVDLLRAELDLLKQAFRRHCAETT